jgi:hypothetical protein
MPSRAGHTPLTRPSRGTRRTPARRGGAGRNRSPTQLPGAGLSLAPAAQPSEPGWVALTSLVLDAEGAPDASGTQCLLDLARNQGTCHQAQGGASSTRTVARASHTAPECAWLSEIRAVLKPFRGLGPTGVQIPPLRSIGRIPRNHAWQSKRKAGLAFSHRMKPLRTAMRCRALSRGRRASDRPWSVGGPTQVGRDRLRVLEVLVSS